MMEIAYTRDVNERNRALESLAKMKELEAKRKKKMKTVRLDTRTVVTATKNALKAKMEQFRKENPISAGCASRAEKYRKQRREILKECFEEHPTLFQARPLQDREESVRQIIIGYKLPDTLRPA